MPLQRTEVLTIAHLARLDLTDSELEQYTGELSAILTCVEQMNAVNTDGVTPMAHPLDRVQPLRPDAVTESDLRDAYQAQAPAVRDGLYLVPKVIE